MQAKYTPMTPHKPLPLEMATPAEIEDDFWRELAEIEAESMGWIALDAGAYLHRGAADATVIEIVGVATASMADSNVLWLV